MARVLVGVTGGIAAYKACELVRLLVKSGHEVVPLVTPGAERFVRAETFFGLARRSPAEDLYVHLTRADLLVVAPLTANTLASLANGQADNLVTQAALAHRGAGPAGAGDEPAHVVASRDPGERRDVAGSRRAADRARGGRFGGGGVGRRPGGRARGEPRALPG